MSSSPRELSTVAVIDIGATAIRLVVAELDGEGGWRRLDRASKPISLGKDVFMTGQLSQENMQQAIRILGGFCELLSGWAVEREAVQVIATSAIREAKNRDAFVDRVFIRTGLRIDVLEGIEENHLTFLAVQNVMRPMRAQFSRASAMIIEVGGGTTELMLLHRGKMVAAHSLRVGTVRIEHQARRSWSTADQIEDFIRENVRASKELLASEMKLDRVRFFIAVGGDARMAARRVGRRESDDYWLIDREEFDRFISMLQDQSPEELVSRLEVTYNEAEGLLPALLIYRMFLEETNAQQLIVPDVSIREGVLMSFALGNDWAVEPEFYSQVVASAKNLGRRYHYDEAHAGQVAQLAVQIFDQLTEEHGMDRHGRLMLEVAAILHDIGTYVRASGHHKHGYYLVTNSEVFGVSRDDLDVIANVVRYHRKAVPSQAHSAYISLRREQRITVLKLAAILRLADALDRSHHQRVSAVSVERSDEDLILKCEARGDISVERFGVSIKSDMFEEVFGYNVVVA